SSSIPPYRATSFFGRTEASAAGHVTPHRLRGDDLPAARRGPAVDASDYRQRPPGHFCPLPERHQGVFADRSDRLRRRYRWSRTSRVWWDAVRRIEGGSLGVLPGSRTVSGGSALAGSE